MTRKQHFVTFYSPGTFVSETTTKPIEAWDTAMAVSMAKAITERHGSKPYAFQFATSLVADAIDDGQGGKMEVMPKQIAESGMYHINGAVRSYDDVVAADIKDESIMRSNMHGNGWWFVVETRNSWKHTAQFNANDFTVDGETGAIIERGDTPERIGYRAAQEAKREQEYAQMRQA